MSYTLHAFFLVWDQNNAPFQITDQNISQTNLRRTTFDVDVP